MAPRLTRRKIQNGEVLVVAIAGAVDISNSFHVGEAILADAQNTTRGVVLDLSEVEYLDSSGVHLILDVRRRLANRRQQLRLVVPDDSFLLELLTLTSVASLARVHAREEDAVTELLSGPGAPTSL